MLDLMLGNGSDCFSTGEFYGLFKEEKIGCSCLQGDDCPVWQAVKPLGERHPHQNISKIVGKSIISDSSKIVKWISKHHSPNDDVVVIYKHPLNYLYSCHKRGHRSPWQTALRLWRWWTYYPMVLEKFPVSTIISYRDLTTHPSEVLEKVCSIVGVEYFPEKERFWEGTPHILYGSGSARTHLYGKESSLYRERSGEEVEFHRSIYYSDRWKKELLRWQRKLFWLMETTYHDLERRKLSFAF